MYVSHAPPRHVGATPDGHTCSRRRVIVRPGGHASAAAAAQQRHAGVSAEADDEEVDVQAVEEEGAVATNTSRGKRGTIVDSGDGGG